MGKSTYGFAVVIAAVAMSMMACQAETTETEDLEFTRADIVGGTVDTGHAAVGLINWTVDSGNGKTGSSACSSALVAPKVVLTAAHCVVPANANETFKDFIVYFGNTPGKAQAKEVFKVVKTVPHPRYSPKVFGDFDVAIMLLDREVPIAPAKMARTIGNVIGQPVTHVGWGTSISKSATEKSGSGTKRTVALPVTAQQDLVIQTGNGKSGICNGDSGGPAIISVKGQDIVVGVHSFIDDNATCLKNGFSARVDRYVDFFLPFVPNAFVDLQSGGKGTTPPPPAADDGSGGGQCCLNGECFQCPTKAAMDKCVGLDLDACFDQCGQKPSCLIDCAKKLQSATHDPSACDGAGGDKGDEADVPGDDGKQGCSVSVKCSNGECRCGGLKAGAVCDGKSGLPSSCDVLCRVCN